METMLTAENRREIDRQLGRLANIIGKQMAVSFGLLEKVASGTGSRSWRHAFITLFEGVLRDAEDMFIHLPYTEIRQEIARLASVLEEITLPQLVIVDFGQPSQVILDPESKQLSGVIDLGSAVWGDVLMAEIFENPSPAVLEGFGSNPTNGRSKKTRLLLSVCPDGSSFPGSLTVFSYACYRYIYKITEQYYRKTNEADEIQVRRRLTATLAKMAAMECE
ncbi:hypothetical protein VTN00DRAFT_1785 [Thermoascus crustaceus]|uniref:uncharacterized protein n=1 Tax=Thermoascus crustaceus TaxID=5088 RepID=UPI003744A2A9